MLQVSLIDVDSLLDPDAALSFVTPLVARSFGTLPNIFNETFMVTTSVGDSVFAKRVYRNRPIMFPIELLMSN